MSNISTYWEKDLNPPREAFKVTGDVGYTKSTDILLNFIEVVGVGLSHCTATFEVDVVGDRGDSAIVIYNNGIRVPFYISNTEYQQLAWNSQSSKTTITIPLNYDTTNSIQAKYLGNSQCLGSKSKFVNVTEPRPIAAETSLDISIPKLSYHKSESISGTITLNAEDYYSDAPIKVYLNNDLLTTVDTDSEGVASFTILSSDLGTGINNITAKFDGDTHIYGSEESVDVSYGWNIEILTYDKIWLNYIGAVDIRVSDYFGNPISNETFVTDESINSVGVLSGTTDIDGYATIENHNEDTPRFSSFVIYSQYDDVSESIVPRNAYINEFEVISQGVIADKYTLPITVHVTAIDENNQQVSVKGLKVFSKLSNPAYTYLDENGEASFEYLGESCGDIVETITLGSKCGSKSINIEDCVTYWTKYADETEYWFDNSFRVESAKVTNSSTYRLSGIDGFGQIHFDTWKNWSSEWTFEMQVSSITKPESMMLCGYYLTEIKPNDWIKVTHEGNTRRVYVNDVLKDTYQGNDYTYPILTFNQGILGRLELKRLKFKINVDDIYNIGNLGKFTIENDMLCVEFDDTTRYCDYSLENGYLYVETDLPEECFILEDGVLYCVPPTDD